MKVYRLLKKQQKNMIKSIFHLSLIADLVIYYFKYETCTVFFLLIGVSLLG
jgi:hypothetical protein